MDYNVTGATIRMLREKKGMTQTELAKRLDISDKTVSKWENSRGLPDVSILEPLARALDVSLTELLSGEKIVNRNVSGNMLRARFYICPVCGNVLYSLGDAAISCCGIQLSACVAELPDQNHEIVVEQVENEHFLTVLHPMTKQHYISFLAYVSSDRLQLVKLYPEGNAQTRLQLRGMGYLYLYCNKHGLMRKKI